MKKQILITGGAGFVGANLCGRLLGEGNVVYCLDNFNTGRRENIEEFLSNPNFYLLEMDICQLDFDTFTMNLDQIYNLACPASPPKYQIDPLYTLDTSVIGVRNILELGVRNGAKVLHASTSEIYGDPLVHPQKEDYWGNVNPLGIRSCYDEGKRCAETYCMEYARKYRLDVKIVRIFNTYGPKMDSEDGRVISNFIMQALKGENLTVYGDGSQTRSFQYIDDLLEGMLKMMDLEGFIGPVNIGNDREFTVLELANLVSDLLENSGMVQYLPLPGDDPKRRRPDIALAKEKLGWQPRTELREGLGYTIDYFKTLL